MLGGVQIWWFFFGDKLFSIPEARQLTGEEKGKGKCLSHTAFGRLMKHEMETEKKKNKRVVTRGKHAGV